MQSVKPLLTIAIPTWNRASYLALTLDQLEQTIGDADGSVEVLVCDNCSPDGTTDVVRARHSSSFPIRYVRNPENIGSDANIALCFDLALGSYVLILGDDDLLLDGTIAALKTDLASRQYGVVCLRPYGYENDFRREFPGAGGTLRPFTDPGEFLAAIGPYITLISSCVINKDVLLDLSAAQFCGGNLVQVHLVLRAALATTSNLFVDDYRIACKRNNSGGYDFATVFVDNLGDVLDAHISFGLAPASIAKIENALLLGYYPTYFTRQRLARAGDLAATRRRLARRFGGRWLYWPWVAPILYLPRPLAIAWGGVTTAIGRAMTGHFRRGLVFAGNRLRRKFT